MSKSNDVPDVSNDLDEEYSPPSSPLEEDEEVEDGDDNDEGTGLMEVLRYLLQGNYRGDLRIRLVGNGGIGSDDSSDDDIDTHVYNSRQLNQHRVPQPPSSPDTSVIDKSELKEQVVYESNSVRPLTRKHSSASLCIPALLCKKEIGQLNRAQNVGIGQRVASSKPYLPTKYNPTKLLNMPDKFFCGIYNKEGDLFMSACQDTKLRVFDTSDGQWTKLKTIDCKDIGWSVLDVGFSHAGNHIIYSSWSEYIHICNIRGEPETHKPLYLDPGDQYRFGIFSLCFNADDTEIIAGSNGGYIYIYNRETDRRSLKIDAHDDDLSSVCFADDSGHIFYSGGEDAVIKIWDRRNLREDFPQPVGQLSGHYDSVTHIDSKNDARYLITNSKDQSIKLWDIRKCASSAGVNATKSAVAKQNWDYRWHPYVGKVVKKKLPGDCSLMTYFGHIVVRTLIRARFSPSFTTGQRYIYSGDGLGRIVIYDLITGKIARILEGYYCNESGRRKGHKRDVVRDVSWHPYDNNLISSGWDGSVQRWECNIAENEKNICNNIFT